MTLKEAIKILTDLTHRKPKLGVNPLIEAAQLGIEALKAWKQFREGRWISGCYDLPGETKEVPHGSSKHLNTRLER